ncbi:MAG: tetratricopeptide repeat protein [Flammeovirgaceae bacterium]|nr:tetratricopeptide repeat protein [Flammeovirgaceae bacterium]
MENEENYIEFIENYLANKLTKNEAQEFEELCQNNEGFKSLYLDIKTILPGIQYSTKKEIKSSLKKMGLEQFSNDDIELYKQKADQIDLQKSFGVKISPKEAKQVHFIPPKNQKTTSWFSYKTMAIAASIALLIAAYLVFSTPKSESLYDLAYNEIGQGPYTYINSDDENLTVVRGAEAEKLESIKQQAYNAYSLGQYKNAIDFFNEVLEKDEDRKVKFYLGNALLANNQPELAIPVFNEILAKSPGEYEPRTKWYLGISFLKNGELEKAELILKDLAVNGKDSYKGKAEKILQEF